MTARHARISLQANAGTWQRLGAKLFRRRAVICHNHTPRLMIALRSAHSWFGAPTRRTP